MVFLWYSVMSCIFLNDISELGGSTPGLILVGRQAPAVSSRLEMAGKSRGAPGEMHGIYGIDGP